MGASEYGGGGLELRQGETGTVLHYWTSGSEITFFFQKHRVAVPAKDSKWSGERYSIIYFVAPDYDFTIRCLDGSDTFAPSTGRADHARYVSTIQGAD